MSWGGVEEREGKEREGGGGGKVEEREGGRRGKRGV